MLPPLTNLFPAPEGRGEETIAPLLRTPFLNFEHIVSRGQASPRGFWYDQMDPEWVLLLRGTATLDFGGAGMLDLRAGDSLTLPAHAKHRVDKVSEDAVWVALHFRSEARTED
jgi:cupin 2 domain-containing protein